MLLENIMENDKKQNPNGSLAMDPQGDDDEEELTPEEAIEQFNMIYQSDPELQALLGDQPEQYSVDEKITILSAYKKGGGVRGLDDIIEKDEEKSGIIPPNDPQGLLPDG